MNQNFCCLKKNQLRFWLLFLIKPKRLLFLQFEIEFWHELVRFYFVIFVFFWVIFAGSDNDNRSTFYEDFKGFCMTKFNIIIVIHKNSEWTFRSLNLIHLKIQLTTSMSPHSCSIVYSEKPSYQQTQPRWRSFDSYIKPIHQAN